MSKGLTLLIICAAAAFAILAWIASGISLLDDDWGHLKLASKGVVFALTTGWEGLVGQGGYYRPAVVLILLSGLFNWRLCTRYLSHPQYRDSRGMRVSRFFLCAMPLHRPHGGLGRRVFIFCTPHSHRFRFLDRRTHRSLVYSVLSKRTNFIF